MVKKTTKTNKPQVAVSKKKRTVITTSNTIVETPMVESIPNPRSDYEIQIDRIYTLQKQNRWKIANTTAKERIEKLKRLQKAIEERIPDLQIAVHKDFKKSPHEALLTEILPSIQEIKDAYHNVAKWMKPVSVPTPLTLFGSSSKIIYEPKGQVLIIGPWNYPFQLIISPLAAAIAAGNVCIIRPSNNTHHTGELIKNLLGSVFPEDEVAVILGDRPSADYLLTKQFDHIFFTGSPAVGTIIMEAAAKNLTSVTLELGGKSPVIIDETANMDHTVTNVIWGKILNGGQTCIGVDYALVHESKIKEFVEKAKAKLREFYGENPESWKSNPDFCRVINDKNYNRLKFLVEDSVANGAKLEDGGIFDDSERYISPTILTNVPLNREIMQEEIFGPILPIISYKHIDDAIKIIQNKQKPLALYIFTEKESTMKKVLKNTSSGGAVINGVILHIMSPYLPFGGVNHSGLGNYHGYFGFKTFSHERALLSLNKLDLLVLRKMMPPYTDLTTKIANWIMKYL
jgi:aldehyde dehydrogenase (NAD+)